MRIPKAVLFDLDDTLAESFQPPTPDMLEKLVRLLAHMPVAIVTAASYTRMERDILPHIARSPHADRFYAMPDSTTQCYTFVDGAWQQRFHIAFREDERAHIERAMREAVAEVGLEHDPRFEPRVVQTESKVAYAALGLGATLEAKEAWDPDMKKRARLQAALARRLPEYEVIIGGKTTIDVLPRAINKAHGVLWLARELGVEPADMLFVGDAFYEGGNDRVVIPTGIETRAVSGPAETARVIDELLAALR